MQFELYPVTTLRGMQWRWRLRAGNHKIVASGESYINRADCIHAVNLLMNTTLQTTFVEVAE